MYLHLFSCSKQVLAITIFLCWQNTSFSSLISGTMTEWPCFRPTLSFSSDTVPIFHYYEIIISPFCLNWIIQLFIYLLNFRILMFLCWHICLNSTRSTGRAKINHSLCSIIFVIRFDVFLSIRIVAPCPSTAAVSIILVSSLITALSFRRSSWIYISLLIISNFPFLSMFQFWYIFHLVGYVQSQLYSHQVCTLWWEQSIPFSSFPEVPDINTKERAVLVVSCCLPRNCFYWDTVSRMVASRG